jgi:hypothetical protein
MYCKRYRADIPEVTCIARQERAKGKKWRSSDPGCRKCPQGQQLLLLKTQGKAIETPQPASKECKACGHMKDLKKGYHPDPGTKDGYKSVCKVCFNVARQRRRDLQNGGIEQPTGLNIYPVGTNNQFARLEARHA